ncbi:hypothetical protein [Paucibacter sp. XJ19-41]|uniref:hypothetical protein n=1 Tax=Paucibacter sp. XJ19-41 TaxID=2927824 RepID=UPI002349A1DD|nr:hypothetical protein [Paucibacter sp. XJ19-41]MDC6166065.1 hypothetical protein [Paucibacter sp. XJ19-41]
MSQSEATFGWLFSWLACFQLSATSGFDTAPVAVSYDCAPLVSGRCPSIEKGWQVVRYFTSCFDLAADNANKQAV